MLTAPPDAGAYTNDIVTAGAREPARSSASTRPGESYQPIEVTLQEGGA